jgi:hypothetical protein
MALFVTRTPGKKTDTKATMAMLARYRPGVFFNFAQALVFQHELSHPDFFNGVGFSIDFTPKVRPVFHGNPAHPFGC